MEFLTPEMLKQYGFMAMTCVFVTVYISTVVYTFREMKAQREKDIEKAEKIAQVIVENTLANNAVAAALNKNLEMNTELVIMIRMRNQELAQNSEIERLRHLCEELKREVEEGRIKK